MKVLTILIASLSINASATPQKSFHTHLKDFCKKHLIADDPYQYENTPVDSLEMLVTTINDQVVWIELRARMNAKDTPEAERKEIEEFFKSIEVTRP